MKTKNNNFTIQGKGSNKFISKQPILYRVVEKINYSKIQPGGYTSFIADQPVVFEQDGDNSGNVKIDQSGVVIGIVPALPGEYLIGGWGSEKLIELGYEHPGESYSYGYWLRELIRSITRNTQTTIDKPPTKEGLAKEQKRIAWIKKVYREILLDELRTTEIYPYREQDIQEAVKLVFDESLINYVEGKDVKVSLSEILRDVWEKNGRKMKNSYDDEYYPADESDETEMMADEKFRDDGP